MQGLPRLFQFWDWIGLRRPAISLSSQKTKSLLEKSLNSKGSNQERRLAPAVTLDNLLASFGGQEAQALNIVVKADVKVLEAIVAALHELGNDEVRVNVVFSGVGGLSETDINYAVTANAVVFGFNVRADTQAKRLVEKEGIDLRYYKVIYDLVDDVKAALSGMLAQRFERNLSVSQRFATYLIARNLVLLQGVWSSKAQCSK